MKNIIKVVIKPNSSKNEITKIENNTYYVSIKERPEKGKANKELIQFLSKKLGKKVRIKTGFRSRKKILEFC